MLGDLARLGAGLEPANLAHGDLSECLDKLALAKHPRLLAQAVEALAQLRADIDLNLDPAAALERASLVLAARDPAELVC